MPEFSSETINAIDRELNYMPGRVRPEYLDPAFEQMPELVAIGVDLLLSQRSNALIPSFPVCAWRRTERNKVKDIAAADMSAVLSQTILRLVATQGLTDCPLSQYAEKHADAEDTCWYRVFFMRDVTIIGWADPQDGMASIEGEDIEDAYPRPSEFLGIVYATQGASNHEILNKSKRIEQDVLDHHRLIKTETGVSFVTGNLIQI
jgi:hypothetical protein